MDTRPHEHVIALCLFVDGSGNVSLQHREWTNASDDEVSDFLVASPHTVLTKQSKVHNLCLLFNIVLFCF